MTKKYHIQTFGCQMNVHDSEKIAGIFSETGMTESSGKGDADVIVLNTCSIREKAEHKFYSELGRLKIIKKNNPKLKIAVAGCIAKQRGKKLIKQFPYIDYMFGPNNIDSLQGWIDNGQESTNNGQRIIAINDNPDYPMKLLPIKRNEEGRAWVSIMYGCDNFCAYCIVPYTRGRERSRPAEDIINEIELLARHGVREITLLGQNVNSYGRNIQGSPDFPELLEKIHDIAAIERIRFMTSHPKDFSGKLISVIEKLPKVCNHLHLPLQAGSDNVLDMMNRKYTYADYKSKIDLLKKMVPGVAITSDIIAGFPGETDDDFEQTIKALEEIKYDGIFAFKYSKRPGTKAIDLPGHIDEDIKTERLLRIIKLQEVINYNNNRPFEGKTVEILVEGPSGSDPEIMTGRTMTYKILNFKGSVEDINKLVNVKITKAKQHSLDGEKV